jgi:putative Ig domain-containing protein
MARVATCKVYCGARRQLKCSQVRVLMHRSCVWFVKLSALFLCVAAPHAARAQSKPSQSLSQCIALNPTQKQVATSDKVTLACPSDARTTSLTEPLSDTGREAKLAGKIDLPKDLNISTVEASLDKCPSDLAVVVHVAVWKVGKSETYGLDSSEWHVYHPSKGSGGCVLDPTPLKANDQPLLYADKSALLIGITLFREPVDPNKVIVLYKFSTTPEVPENIQNLSALLAALLGATLPTSGPAGEAAVMRDTFVAVTFVPGDKRLPFDFNFTYSMTPNASKNAGGAPSPKSGNVGEDYNFQIPVKGGIGPYHFTVASGSLPPGLTLDANTGKITGKPTVGGDFKSTVEVKDSSVPPLVSHADIDLPVTSTMSILLGGAQTIRSQPADTDAESGPGASKPTDSTKNGGTSKNTGAQNSNQSGNGAQVVDCTATTSDSPCTISRSFRSDDKEFFDFSLAVAIPGPKETIFSTSSSGSVQHSVKTHTDMYAMLDLYPGYLRWNKESGAPHLVVGLPVTSQVFHRPFFGVAENFTSWTGLQTHGLPLQISVFGGIVYMQTNSPALKPSRVAKAMFGVELSVGALVSKIGGGGGKSKAKS